MKKVYVKPSVMECVVIANEIIASSQPSTLNIKVGDDIETGTTDAARGRGEWGNLW